MNNLVIDLTHGGVKIAVTLAKKGRNVLAYDLYSTLDSVDREMLRVYNVELIELSDLSHFKGDMNVIYPVHMPLSFDEITCHNPDLNYTFHTHHESIARILDGWGDDIKKVEVTGVKGKTTSVFMLKEILSDENPLVLSSLGALLYENGQEYILKRNISIAPANIKESIDLAYKMANPVCKISEGVVERTHFRKYSSAIFESSLGVSGIGDVGLLLNICEDYPIAKGRSCASKAKRQIFRCPCVCIEKEAFDRYYSNVKHYNCNTFSLNDASANLCLIKAEYNLDKSEFTVRYNNVKSVNGNILSGEISFDAFAPGHHHASNILGVILTSLCLEIETERIVEGIGSYKGIAGRTNKKQIGNTTIIEEINPGLNTQSIKDSISMISNPNDYYIAVGGDYGITCEEIDEEKLSDYLNTLNTDIILTGDLGSSIASKLHNNYSYIENYAEIYDLAVKNDMNLLFIYRSDYRKLSLR